MLLDYEEKEAHNHVKHKNSSTAETNPRDIYNAHEYSRKEWEEKNLAMIDCYELGVNKQDWCI